MMFIYKVNMYLGLKGGLAENEFGRLYSTGFVESDTELSEYQVAMKYYEKITKYPKTHYLEISKYKGDVKMNKDNAIEYLKEINKGKRHHEIVTRLYYGDGNEYVQDLSYFVEGNFMSDELEKAIANGQTLTSKQEKELQNFIIEKYI